MRPKVLFALVGMSSLFAGTHATAQKHLPVWPDDDFPPLVSANRLFSAVQQTCPQQGWNEHLPSHTEEGPWDRVAEKLQSGQNARIEKVQQQCVAGMPCPADIRFGMEVQMGYLVDLVRSICSQKAPRDWGLGMKRPQRWD